MTPVAWSTVGFQKPRSEAHSGRQKRLSLTIPSLIVGRGRPSVTSRERARCARRGSTRRVDASPSAPLSDSGLAGTAHVARQCPAFAQRVASSGGVATKQVHGRVTQLRREGRSPSVPLYQAAGIPRLAGKTLQRGVGRTGPIARLDKRAPCVATKSRSSLRKIDNESKISHFASSFAKSSFAGRRMLKSGSTAGGKQDRVDFPRLAP
jgi:hypothetical protein